MKKLLYEKSLFWLMLLVAGPALPGSATAQLVNIESRRMHTDSLRRVFKADFGLSYRDNDGARVFQSHASLAFQVKSKNLRSVYLWLGSYELIHSSGQDLINNWFGHVRYDYKLNRKLRPELFLQVQRNLPLLIDQRWLAGAGLRIKLADRKKIKLYAGELYMFEKERSVYQNIYQDNSGHRSDSYLSCTLLPADNWAVYNTLYFQPSFTDISDYRLLDEFRIELGISQHLSVNGSLRYYRDSRSPKGSALYAFSNDAGFSLNF